MTVSTLPAVEIPTVNLVVLVRFRPVLAAPEGKEIWTSAYWPFAVVRVKSALADVGLVYAMRTRFPAAPIRV